MEAIANTQCSCKHGMAVISEMENPLTGDSLESTLNRLHQFLAKHVEHVEADDEAEIVHQLTLSVILATARSALMQYQHEIKTVDR